MIPLNTTLSHYKREDIQREMLIHAQDKEVSIRFGDKGFGKRPDILSFPGDILSLAKKGATSFHVSEERWNNPLQLNTGMKKSEMDNLRKGWDLVIDIDCPYFPYSKIAAELIIKALKHHNISAISIKFSGNKGFHIGVPFEAFPKNIDNKPTSKRFPEDLRSVALYIKKMVENLFAKKVIDIENGDIVKIAKNLKMNIKDMLKENDTKKIDPDKILDIDTILISSRHLYRMPYSLHEKSGLVSIPINPDKLDEFDRELAKPEKIIVDDSIRFLDRTNAKQNEAKDLFDKAIVEGEELKDEYYLFQLNKKKDDFSKNKNKEIDIPQEAISKEFFPPSIKNILKGIKDGKKRALFLLVNFLTCVGWNYDDIEKLLTEWNEKNEEPLRESLITGQIRYHKQNKKNILPPNYSNKAYYYDLGVLTKEEKDGKFNNPVSLTKHMLKMHILNSKKTKKKTKEEKDKSKNNNKTDNTQKNTNNKESSNTN